MQMQVDRRDSEERETGSTERLIREKILMDQQRMELGFSIQALKKWLVFAEVYEMPAESGEK